MGQNGFDHAGRIVAFNGNAHVRQGVSLAPRMVEHGKLAGIAGQRPVRSQRHAALDQLEGQSSQTVTPLFWSKARLAGSANAPPPSATTAGLPCPMRWT